MNRQTARRLAASNWEDAALLAATLAWIAAPKSMGFFHLYTAAVMVLVLSLGFKRGLAVGLSRTFAACGVLAALRLSGAMPHPMGMQALAELKRERGGQFDPAVIDALERASLGSLP